MSSVPDWTAFDWLIAPLDRATFLEDSWERRPQAIHRADPDYFSSLIGRADIDTIAPMFRAPLIEADQRQPPIRLVRFLDGERPGYEPVAAGNDGGPDLYQLYRAYAAGWTVVIGPLGGRWPPLTSLCARLETALHHRVAANVYLTPPEAQGFPPHDDTHDVFIVQVEGAKTWRISRPCRELPPVHPPFHDLLVSPHDAEDVQLDAGDVLYVPRGWMHEARTSAVPSLHVTIGVHVTRWSDLLSDVVTAAAEGDIRLRRALPPGYLDAADGLSEHLRALLAELADVDEASVDRAIDRTAQRFLGVAQSTVGGQFASLAELPMLTLDSHVEIVTALCRVADDGDGVNLQLPGRRVRFRVPWSRPFGCSTMGDRPRWSTPGRLSDDAKLVLVRRLVRDGVVRIVSG